MEKDISEKRNLSPPKNFCALTFILKMSPQQNSVQNIIDK